MSTIRRLVIALIGVAVVLAGVAMLFLPGPGLITIAAGLALLGTEFDRPRRWLASLRERFVDLRSDDESL